jgi:coenzyme F420-reducing hydrogenase alpha subunit
MSTVHVIEHALGITIDPQVRLLRRLFYCGEWIESHALHVFMLHAPDFLGYPDAIAMAKDHRALVEQGLRLKKTGNRLVALLGGREIHPISACVGGFYKVPTKAALQGLVDELRWALDAAVATVQFAAGLEFPDFEQDYEFVALRHPSEYPLCEGRLVSNRGLDIAAEEYEQHFIEEHVPHSNALHSVLRGRGSYHVGPLARYALNFDRLTPRAQSAARSAGLPPVCKNPFQSIVVRSVELLWACEEALRLVREYEPFEPASVAVEPRAGVGHGMSEAPRGVLYHRYGIDAGGLVTAAKIVPPTSQNQKTIENDLWHLVPGNLGQTDDELRHLCEQAVRNYDPCISCATHFLRLVVEGR